MRPARWIPRLAGLLIVGLAVGVGMRLLPRKAVPVHAVRPVRGEVRDVVSSATAGEVRPLARALVRAELGGRVEAVLHRAGERVQEGEVVVRLDSAELQARTAQAYAAVEVARGQLAQATERLAMLRRQAERARGLFRQGAGTAQISEDAEAAVREAEHAQATVRAQLHQAQAALMSARVQQSRAQIVAPLTGLLIEVFPEVGETLSPGAPVLEIIDDSRLHVEASVDEADAARVRPGQQVELRLEALPNQPIRGRVLRVDPVVKRDAKGARTLGVDVEVEDTAEAQRRGLRPGMSANLDIVVARKLDVLSLPTSTIVGRGVRREVYVLRPEGRLHRAERRTVQVGLSNWEWTEITAGVGPNDLVAASLNQKGLEDGALVRLLPADEAGGRTP
ncbi:MAG: efflux RND transporter periplasmic adaptor subunit [Myxococcales bacterium]|nr:efflux RND transporter periplasmic adaptor subunit [Myxococcota bacterium]MDW8283773.1 efflux RND transporter periplasmic adaptor subunit [Myxococcales bacterium]